MKVLRTELIQAPETALIKELRGTMVDQPLGWCVSNEIPWIAPSPFESWGVDYRGPTPLVNMEAWHGRAWLEGSEKIGDSELYMSMVPEPQRTPNALLRALLKQGVRVFLVNPDNLGTVVKAMALVDPEWQQGVVHNKYLVFPDWIYDKIIRFDYCHFGWAENLKCVSKNPAESRMAKCWVPYEYVEFRYWKDARVLDDITNYDGRAVVYFEEGSKPKVIVAEGWCPVRCGHDLAGIESGFYYAMPVARTRAFKVIPTSLQGIDELLIPRGGIRGKITAAAICSFVSGKLKRSVNTIAEASVILGEYYEQIEDQLVAALNPPRMIVAQRQENKVTTKFLDDDRKILEVSSLQDVQDVLLEVYDASSHASKWIIDMLCRVAVVCHSRHAVIFQADYKTTLFDAGDIIKAIMKAGHREKAGYLNRIVLVSGLAGSELQHRVREMGEGPTETKEAAPLAGLGVSIDDLFK